MPTVMPFVFILLIYLFLLSVFVFLLPKLVRIASVAWYQGKRTVEEGTDKR